MDLIGSILKSIAVGLGLKWFYRILKQGYQRYGRARVAVLVDERGEKFNRVISKLSILDDEFQPSNPGLIRYVSQSKIVGEEFYEDEREIEYVDFLRKLKADHYQGTKFLGSNFDETPPAFKPLRKRIEKDNERHKLAQKKYRYQVFNLLHDCGRFEYLSKLEWVNLCAASELAFAHGKPPISAYFDFCRSVGVVAQVDSFRRYLGDGDHVRATVWAYK